MFIEKCQTNILNSFRSEMWKLILRSEKYKTRNHEHATPIAVRLLY